MMESATLYKKISLEIIEMISKDEIDMIDELLDQRQGILDKESDINKFKKKLIEDGILDIDKKIHNLLSESMDNVKGEIREHRLSQRANNSYINFNKEKLNIFNKKV